MADRQKLRAALLATSALAWLVTPAAMTATHRGEGVPDVVVLQMSYQQATVIGTRGQLVARAIVDDGSPVVGVTVEFLREVDFLGPRLISLGSAMTDAYGTARVPIDTDQATVRIRARFTGSDDYLPAEITSDINVPAAPDLGAGAADGKTGSEPSLAVVAAVMPSLLAAIALAIWLFLIGLSATTVLAIRRARPSVPVRKEGRS